MLRTATNSATPSTATTPTVQDNELPWLDWEHADDQLLAFCADIVAFRLAGTAVAVAAYSLQILRRV